MQYVDFQNGFYFLSTSIFVSSMSFYCLITLFYCWKIFCCTDVLLCVYSFTLWVISLWLLVLVIINKAALNSTMKFSVWIWVFNQLGKYLGTKLRDHMAKLYFACKGLTNCLPKCMYHFAFPQTMNEISCCSIFSPAFRILAFLISV